MSYRDLVQKITGPGGQLVMTQFVGQYAELFVSIDETSTIEKMLSFIRLHSDEFAVPQTDAEIFLAFSQTLGQLLKTGAIQPASYGLSTEGKKQFDHLLFLVGGPLPMKAQPSASDPVNEYSDFLSKCSARELRERYGREKAFADFVDAQPPKPVEDFYS